MRRSEKAGAAGLSAAQNQQPARGETEGQLAVNVTSALGLIPVTDASVTVTASGIPENILASFGTDENGQSQIITLSAPPTALSQQPGTIQPYASYDLEVTAPGYESVRIEGTEVLSQEMAVQTVRMNPVEQENTVPDLIIIPEHTLFGEYPEKIPEAEIKPIDESGEIVLSRVVIPEYVVVHDGVPSDSSAQDYYIRYKDYIKNVASSEVYATWPESTLYANILCIQSFTLNRVYTEWYRNQGYDFTITSSTAYDQKWIYGRNIFSNIDYIVDSIFANYLSRPGVIQPILTAYCDGERVSCRGLSQWGSKYLGEQGYSAIEIIRYYYGNDMFINSAQAISGVPSSYPGYVLSIGASGEKVRQLQQQLRRIAQNYPRIPSIAADGIYGSRTAEAVRVFQQIFRLPQTGSVDYATWYEISDIYVGVSRIAEPG
ncbi:MAG: peptidoglycan-binding protein [Lachnospiraceae bacterium]|nr:peptidoglycan-binding protein [Lachnospiraceae bacterium]